MTTAPQDLPTPVLTALAWRLVDLDLVARPAAGSHSRSEDREQERELWVSSLVDSAPRYERHVADLAVREAERIAGDELEILSVLADALIVLHDRRYALRWVSDEHLHLGRIIHADPLVAMHRLTHGAPPDAVWPAMLRGGDDGFARQLSRGKRAETHSHLSYALPTCFVWALFLVEDIPADQVLSSGLGREAWRKRLSEARAFASSLLESAGGLPLREFVHCERRWLEEKLHLALRAQRHALASRDGPRETDAAATGVLDYIRTRNSLHHAVSLQPGDRGFYRFTRSTRDWQFLQWGLHGPGAVRERRRMRRQVALARAVVECYLEDAAGALDGQPSLGPAAAWRRSMPELDLELRIAPPRGALLGQYFRSWLSGVLHALHPPELSPDEVRRRGTPPLRVGFVCHFKRTDPGSVIHEHMRAFWAFLCDNPDLRPFIVGVDVCSDELSGPPRNFAGAFRWMRDRLDGCADHDAPLPRPGSPIHLGFTCHVGEDFRDLLSGLRHIDEVGSLLGLRPRDRIGHGLALAWNAADYYRDRPYGYPTRGEHLVNLVWLAALCRRRGDFLGRAEVQARIQDLAPAATEARIRDAVELIERPSQEGLRALTGAPLEPWQAGVPSEAQVLAVLGATPASAETLTTVAGDATWVRMVELAQDEVRQRVAKWGLVVEVNPTSNLLIGGFKTFRQLPYLNLFTRGLEGVPVPRHVVPISINTDDLGVFQTSLTSEFERMGHALLAQGQPRGAVELWLDAVRSTGVNSCFIPPWSPRGEDLVEGLRMVLGDPVQDRPGP